MDFNNIDDIRFDNQGLIPAIAQDALSGEVLMLAYMNRESLEETLRSGYATYFSRSRQTLWKKGETSGHTQRVRQLRYDCDGDAILITVEQTGPACHTGEHTCFYNLMAKEDESRCVIDANKAYHAQRQADNARNISDASSSVSSQVLERVYRVIASRDALPVEGSYTNYLLAKGVDKICKKVGEEAAETIVAAVKGAGDELRCEVADLFFHVLVLMYNQGLAPEDVWRELAKREK